MYNWEHGLEYDERYCGNGSSLGERNQILNWEEYECLDL